MINSKLELENFICSHWNEINEFLDSLQVKFPSPIYTSVDIRESKTKYAPVDNNLYPAGFNNLCLIDLNLTGPHFKKYIASLSPHIKNIGIISESNTRNTFYLDHLATLKKCLFDAGFNVYVISFDSELFENGVEQIDLIGHSGFDVSIHRAFIMDQIIKIKVQKENISLCLCLLNHDQSSPIDVAWDSLNSKVEPSPHLGWHRRTKAGHFSCYDQVLKLFYERFQINPGLLEAKFTKVDNVDFSTKEGLERVAQEVDKIILETGCERVFVKADQGTYGMGIHVVSSGSEVLNLNRKQRNKMDVGKNNKKFNSVLVQEGVATILKWDDQPAEVTIYLIGGKSVGGFMRTNPLRDDNSNLNAKGMVFQKFCISDIKENKDHHIKEAVYSVIARLSSIAASMELTEQLS